MCVDGRLSGLLAWKIVASDFAVAVALGEDILLKKENETQQEQ